MSWSRPELVALGIVVMIELGLGAGLGMGMNLVSGSANPIGSAANAEQQLELKLSALRVHKQLLQAEIARVYMETFSPETPLLLEELQKREQDIQLQIETLESKDAQHLALSLAADFGYLQRKLDELKQQLDAMQTNNNNNNNNNSSKQQLEAQRDVVNSTPMSPTGIATTASSYLWRPLLTMPEHSNGSIAPPVQSSPSFIKRLMAMLRPNTAAASTSSGSFIRGHWSGSSEPSTKSAQVQLLSAEELLPQLQLQRQYLDDAIKRLERLAAKKGDKNIV